MVGKNSLIVSSIEDVDDESSQETWGDQTNPMPIIRFPYKASNEQIQTIFKEVGIKEPLARILAMDRRTFYLYRKYGDFTHVQLKILKIIRNRCKSKFLFFEVEQSLFSLPTQLFFR